MNHLSRVILAGAIALSFSPMVSAQSAEAVAVAASAPGARAGAVEIEIRARVVEIDKADRTVTLRGPKGNIVTVDVPPSVKNFAQMSVGDDVVVRHLEAVVAVLEPMSKRTGIRERIETTEVAKAPAGGMPGFAEMRTVEVLAIIQSINQKKNQVTLRGVDVPGAAKPLRQCAPCVSVLCSSEFAEQFHDAPGFGWEPVSPGVDIKKLKVDDEVRVVFTEATVISVEHPTAAAAAPAAAASKP